jgi:hypothetical protein
VSGLLREAAETHHVVFRIVDGDDPDWASWYADWLLDLSELPKLLGRVPVRSHLVHALVQLDRDYLASGSAEPWESWYAEGLRALV